MPGHVPAPGRLGFPGLCAGLMVAALSLVASGQGGQDAAPIQRSLPARLAAQSLLIDVAVRDGRWLAVGERGHIVVSTDAAKTWAQADVPSRALLTGVFMHDASLGWAVGHDETILRTRDGGTTWERVHYAPDNEKPLLDVWFANERQGLAIGAYGTILGTEDGGTTWTSRQVHGDDDFHLNQIVAAPDGSLYIAAEAGHLYRSTDSGATWAPLTSPYQGSFFGVLPLADGPLLAYGLRGNLFRSSDQGTTWERIDTGSEETLTTALQLGPGRYVIGGMAGTLLWSDGAGIRKQELRDRKAITALAAADARTAVTFGEGGVHRLDLPR
ncbi:MAG: hypothetical protein JNM38_14995 [Acidobacteria bacterium]|nr:hypothetical protein [Acidobacteriota bacterium]